MKGLLRESLVAANVRQRPLRTLVSVIGVALGVVLVVLITGLSHGMLREQGQRNANVGAEIIFRRPGSVGITSPAALAMPVQYVDRLIQVSGIKAVSPVGQYVKASGQGFGLEIVEGIDYQSYQQVTNIQIQTGQPLAADDEAIIDPIYAKNKKIKIGDEVEIFAHKFRIVGIYGPEMGARIKLRLSAMQKLLSAPERCSLIYVKCQSSDMQDQAATNILAALPGNQIIFVRDIPSLYERGFPALNTILKGVVVVAVIISTLIIMLAMYTTIMERTREIGILKSLGASKSFIVTAIEKEALLISVLGVLLGYLSTFAAKFFIIHYTSLLIEIEPHWLLYSAGLGLLSGSLGAIYPALRAARQDPIKALSYE
ncbi:MAG: FtsX-like permease family protein [Acidobacteriota bacterium]